MSYNGGEGSSEADAQFSSTKISVWWDIENCQVGRAVDPFAIAQNINSSLKKLNYSGPLSIFAYGDIELIPTLTQRALSSTAVHLNHVPPTPGVKDGSDKMILVDMMLWAADNPAPANVLLISGDRDFAYALDQLKNKGYNVLLAYPKQSSPVLVAVAPTAWLWTDLMAGGEPVTKRELQQVDTSLSVSEGLPNQSSSLVPNAANDLRQDSVKEGNSKLTVNNGKRKGKQSLKSLKSVQRSSSDILLAENEGNTDSGNILDSGFSQASPIAKTESHQLGNNNTGNLPISLLKSTGSELMYGNTDPENSVQGCPKTPPSQGRGTFRQNGKQPQRRSVTMPADNQRNKNSSNSHKSDSNESESQVRQLGCNPNRNIPASEALPTSSIDFDPVSANTLSGNIAQGYPGFPSNTNAFASSSKNITCKVVQDARLDKHQATESLKMAIDDQASLAVGNILLALKILRKEKIMPTKENIADSILYANVDFPTVNINKALEIAIEHQLIQKNIVGTWELYLGKNERQWKCINPSGGSPHQFPSETWSAIRFRLTHRGSRLAILESKSRYEAATVLHKLCLKGYLLGEVLQILEILISSKKWISYNHLDCLPFTINLPEEEPRSEGNCTIS